MSKLFAKDEKKAVLAKFQLNMGAMVPKWERLEDLTIDRNFMMKGYGAPIDLWHFRFESCSFVIGINTSPHKMPEFPRHHHARVVMTAVREEGSPEFVPMNERFWFRQIDAMCAMMPELDELFP